MQLVYALVVRHWVHSFTHTLIAAYMSSPAHIEVIVEEKNEEIAKEKEPAAYKPTKKQLARGKGKSVKVGGGIDSWTRGEALNFPCNNSR